VTKLERSPARDWVTIVLPLSKAEELLGTEYAVWEHSESGEKIVRTMEYSLPESLLEHGKQLKNVFQSRSLSSPEFSAFNHPHDYVRKPSPAQGNFSLRRSNK
jgi:hypothetical protein